jgi:hypothetical protein
MPENTIVHVKGYRVEIISKTEIIILAGDKPPGNKLANEIADYLIWEDFLSKGKIKIGVTKLRK